jgi:antitoxin component YwqK of YwqJK toxin-antitoxin module
MKFLNNIAYSVISSILIISLVSACKQAEVKPDVISNTETKEVITKFPTGEVSRKYNLVSGRKEGIMTDFYKSGIKRAEKNFQNDLQHGKTEVWHENGRLKEVQYYEKGNQILGDTIYHENGKTYMIIPYEKNVKQGDFYMYDSTGVLMYKAKFEKGRLLSESKKK